MQNGKQERTKAGYHHGDGILPFVLQGYSGGDRCAQSALSLCICFGQHKGQLRCGGALAIHISGCLPDTHRGCQRGYQPCYHHSGG